MGGLPLQTAREPYMTETCDVLGRELVGENTVCMAILIVIALSVVE